MGKSLQELASYMVPLAQQLLDQCAAAGLPLTIEDTGRDEATQTINIAAGRSWTPHSRHLPQPPEMKSEAIDCVPTALLTVKYWGWHGSLENSDPLWRRMGEIGESIGLHWGGRWPTDPPHSRTDPGHFQFHHPAVLHPDLSTQV